MFGNGYKYQILGGGVDLSSDGFNNPTTTTPTPTGYKDLEPKPVKNTPVKVRTGGNTAPRPDNTSGASSDPMSGNTTKTQTEPAPAPKETTPILDYDKNQKFIKDFVAKFNRYPYETEYNYFLQTGEIKDLNPQKTKELNPESESNFKIPTIGWIIGGLLALKLLNIKLK